ERGEGQQRIQAVLYHHGFPQRLGLLTGENRHWLEELEVSATAREQVTVALRMIDALDTQSAPITRELRLYARRRPGCRALMGHYGIGELTAGRSSPSSATPAASRCAPSPQSHRCAAAGSPHAPAATTGWTASKDRAAATPRPARRPHQSSCHRPAARHGRGPR